MNKGLSELIIEWYVLFWNWVQRKTNKRNLPWLRSRDSRWWCLRYV
jgi:hypothetical protein